MSVWYFERETLVDIARLVGQRQEASSLDVPAGSPDARRPTPDPTQHGMWIAAGALAISNTLAKPLKVPKAN